MSEYGEFLAHEVFFFGWLPEISMSMVYGNQGIFVDLLVEVDSLAMFWPLMEACSDLIHTSVLWSTGCSSQMLHGAGIFTYIYPT